MSGVQPVLLGMLTSAPSSRTNSRTIASCPLDAATQMGERPSLDGACTLSMRSFTSNFIVEACPSQRQRQQFQPFLLANCTLAPSSLTRSRTIPSNPFNAAWMMGVQPFLFAALTSAP